MLQSFWNDVKNKQVPIKTKMWSLWRGYSSNRNHIYLIDEDNISSNLSDLDCHKMHPINGQYSNWIDDKLVLKYIPSSFDEYLPNHYFMIIDSCYFELKDCPEDMKPDVKGFTNVLKTKGILAVKPISASLVLDLYILQDSRNKIFNNTQLADETLWLTSC